jgi:hypothetical protein
VLEKNVQTGIVAQRKRAAGRRNAGIYWQWINESSDGAKEEMIKT